MTMNDYNALAYRKAILLQLVEDLKGHYPDDTSNAGQIYSNEVPFKDREVPIEALADVENELDKMVNAVNKELSAYSMQKRETDGTRNKVATPRKSSKVTRRKSKKA